MKTNTKFNTSQLVILGLMTAILLLMAYTPLGYLNIGPLAITFNVIPIAIAAITLGPVGGAITGAVFGLTSFIPRLLDGLLLGYIFRGMRKITNISIASFVTGFCSAFLNTALFMSALVLLFGNTEYLQGLIGGKNIILFICGFVGINAVCEMIASTLITGAVAMALYKAHFVPAATQKMHA